MGDKSFLKYNFSLLLNIINFLKGHPWKTKIYENMIMRVPRLLYPTNYFSRVTDRVRSISRPDD